MSLDMIRYMIILGITLRRDMRKKVPSTRKKFQLLAL